MLVVAGRTTDQPPRVKREAVFARWVVAVEVVVVVVVVMSVVVNVTYRVRVTGAWSWRANASRR